MPENCRRQTKNSLLLFSALCLIGAFSVQTQAQSIISGDVTGTVTDPTSAAIAGVAVILTNVNTNTSQKTTTNAGGSYRFAFVPPGTYKVDVSATAFQTQERPGVLVTAGQPTTVSLQLMVASATQVVDVVEAPSFLQTE